MQAKTLSLIKKTFHTGNDLLPTTKRFKFSDECQMRELVEGLQLKNTTNSCRRKIVFQYGVCVQSFEPLCGGRMIVFQYGDSV